MHESFSENLSNNYIELLNEKEDYNVIIEVGESETYAKKFRAHSAILKSRSSYFRGKLSNTGKDNDIKTIYLNDVSTQQFEILIKYIYGGVVLLEDYDGSFIFELTIVAYKFLLEELAKYLESYLIKNRTSWLYQQFVYVYQETFQKNNKLQRLREWCDNTVAKYPNLIFESNDFKSLQENALSWLIKQEDLAVEELKVWNYVIKWGIAQNSELSSNPKNWSQENFKALKISIKSCLPSIRYFKISNDDIAKKVGPYKQVFEQQLWNNIINRKPGPSRVESKPKSPLSTIVDKKHMAKIASWIDKKAVTYDIKNNPYEFKLLLRGSNDGFTPDSFWKLCDQQENTVVIMKVKGADEILGGYNPLKWDKNHNGQMRCSESFIFSLNKDFVDESILSRVKIPEHALYVHSTYGPTFVDLGMYGNFNYAKKCFYQRYSYKRSILNAYIKNFSVDEYEVFKVIRKAK